MTGSMNGLSTRSGDTEKAMDGVLGRELWEAGKVKRENTEVSDTGAADKQVEQENAGIPARTVRTRVMTDRKVQEKYREQKNEEKAAAAKADAIAEQLAWIEENLVPADVEDLEEEATPYDDYTSEQLEQAVRRVKEGRAARQEGLERQVEKRRQLREQLQTASLDPAEKRMAERLEATGMPVTQANLEKLSGAFEMAEQAVGRLGERSFSWLMGNQLESSVSNLYRASLMETGTASGVGSGQNGTGKPGIGSKNVIGDAWAQIESQAAARLEQEGVPVTEETMREARWLFEQGLAIDGRNMAELESLQQLAGLSQAGEAGDGDALQEEMIDRMTARMAVGDDPADAVLGNARRLEAEYAINRWNRIDVDGIRDITARRQMEEIRLKLTVEAAMRLLDKGIRLDTENLSQIVEGLKELESNYYQKLCAEQGTVRDGQAELLQEVTEKGRESLGFSMYALGSVYRSAGQITFEDFYEQGRQLTEALAQGTNGQLAGQTGGTGPLPSESAGTGFPLSESVAGGVLRARAEMAYETMATEIRADLGDSIRKAFRSVDSLLTGLDLAVNEANERAVRILGYNRLEITPESVDRMRYYDSRVAETLRELRPGTVLRMIRAGQNPLDMSMEELGDTVRELSEEGREEESRSRFLWKLEKQDGITEEERSAYIGIYRLLHQIEKSDGAAIGAVVGAGQDLTLQNLLTAVRTRRLGGIDRVVEEDGERIETAGISASITEQIAAGYRGGSEHAGRTEQSGEGQNGAEQGRAGQMRAELTLEDARQLGKILEEPEEDYRQWQAERLTEQLADSREAVQFLQGYGIDSTPVLLAAAGELLSSGWITGTSAASQNGRPGSAVPAADAARSPLAGLTEGLSPAEQERLRLEGEKVLDSLGRREPEEFQEQVRQLQNTVLEQVRQAEQSETLTFERLQQLRLLGQVMGLSEQLVRQEHYEIPVVEEDGSVSCIRLALRHTGRREESKMELSMRLPDTGEPVKGDFWLRDGRLEGYFRCDSRQSLETLEQRLPDIQGTLGSEGYETGSLTCHLAAGISAGISSSISAGAYTGMHTGRYPEGAGETGNRADAAGNQTRQLYHAAKIMIDAIRYQEGDRRS